MEFADYKSEFDRPPEYYKEIQMPTVGDYRDMLRFKDQNTARYDKRYQAACAVIDCIVEELGIEDHGLYLYGLDGTGSTPIVRQIKELFDRAGDKVKLKKRIAELENENNVLRSLVTGK